MKGINYLNSYNENKQVKRMDYAYPYFTGTFPDYNGVLRQPYNDMASESTENIIGEMIQNEKEKMTSVQSFF